MKSYLKMYGLGFLLVGIFHLSALSQSKTKLKKEPTQNDTLTTNYWRKKGFEAKSQGSIEKALAFYKKVLFLDTADYDAKLAIANLYYKNRNYNQALVYYGKIYQTDNHDVEALHGLGKCYLQLENYSKAVDYLAKAVVLLPTYIPIQLDLAKAYTDQGALKKAKNTYIGILQQDEDYLEALYGAAQINYWMDLPGSAAYYIKKAYKIDPSSKKIEQQYLSIMNALKYEVNLKFNHIAEMEEGVTTKTNIAKAAVNKRIGNYFNIAVNSSVENSHKSFEMTDTSRKFDNTFARFSFLHSGQTLSAFAGASVSDSRCTSYGGSYTGTFKISKLKIRNTLFGSYEYFYYWRGVDRNVYGDNLTLSCWNFTLEGDYKRGAVRYNYIWDWETKDVNPFLNYMIGLKYKFFKNPSVTVGFQHSYVNYEAHSPLYFSPYQRSLNGFSINPYYQYKKFYIYAGYSRRVDNYENKLWSTECELGYSIKNLSLAGGGSIYMDPYYKNKIIFIAITDRF